MSFDTGQSAYKALRSIISERTSGIVFWTGSGLSAEVGLPTWAGLKDDLIQALVEKISQLDESQRTSLQKIQRAVRTEDNNWKSFDLLKNSLGDTTWQATIRESLKTSALINPPLLYEKIWQLHPHGLLTLNLDRLATKSYTSLDFGPIPTEFVGNKVANHTHVLRNPNPFVCQLHGNIDDSSSWILTSSDLGRHLDNQAYQNFIKSCLSTKTVVLLGISADDIAVGGFLYQLASLGIDAGPHYWITSRRDLQTNQWAEERGIRLIYYDAPDEDHSELMEAFNDLVTYVSVDDPIDSVPIIPDGIESGSEALPNQDDLLALSQDAEGLRNALNREATRILSSTSPDAIKNYMIFSSEYDEAIYRAWYTSTNYGNNILLNHVLHEEIARGAFGKVYRATDSNGNNVAVKVLHEEMRQNEDLFHAFRRGVRSMKILSNRDVQGMVPYRKAFEIPAFVVMDWIDGPDLKVAVESLLVSDWELILKVGSEIADIVRRGHLLAERVLHRDLRPSNVMLQGFYYDQHDWDVVVLDFDLSWHKGALEKSVTHGATLLGYLAPEQIEDIPGVSTRHTAVDSFGLGMVLFFMRGGKDPVPDQHRHADWDDTLLQVAGEYPCAQWISVPTRFARLIKYATLHNQSERWDMSQIQAELQRLHEAVLNPESIKSAELIAEEIGARCEFSSGYEWDENLLMAVKEQPSGVKLEIRGDESERRVVVSISWGEPGVQGRRHLGKFIQPSTNSAREILGNSLWRIESVRTNYAHIYISASVSVELARRNMNSVIESLNRALAQLRFS